MQYKIFFLLFCILLLAFSPITPKTVEASDRSERIKLIQQIQVLQQKIQHLQALILSLRLQQKITAASYLAINLSHNSIVLEKNANQPYPIASITKLMNAVVAFENIDTDQTIILTEKMLEPLGYSPSLFLGLNVSAKNLLQASLIQSTNDASESLTYFLGKGKFLDLMNQKAKELGMSDTVFFDAHGLNPANRSTATDIAKLLTYIHKNHTEILGITKNNNFWLPDPTGKLLKFQNVNNFYDLPEFIGGKTGYLPEAKQTSALLFNISKEPIAIILLYSSNRQSDTFKIIDQLKNQKSQD